jgi:SulP family sulfate permease
MAIAIASGTTPDRGLYTAIVAGFVISALGGSRFQIGGPAGAFIVLVAATLERHGYDGFVLATIMAGFFLMALGFLRLGTYIKYIPHSVIVGFTSGIAVIILASQLRDLFGLTLSGKEPAAIVPKLQALWQAASTVNPAAVGIGAGSIAIIVLLKRYRPTWPGLLIAVTLAAGATALFGLPVETIGTRFGGVPSTLPAPDIPEVSLEKMLLVLPDAVAFAMLGGIESLLSAVVADVMTGRRHRSNCELVAQGVANIASALFGGICATGTIAHGNQRALRRRRPGCRHHARLVPAHLHARRRATRLLHSARSAVRGADYGCAEHGGAGGVRRHHKAFARRRRGATRDVLAHRFPRPQRRHHGGRRAWQLRVHAPYGGACLRRAGVSLVQWDQADSDDVRPAYNNREGADEDVMVYRIGGPLFFGAATSIATALEQIGGFPRVVVLDLSAVALADATAALSLRAFVERARRHGAEVFIAGALPGVHKVLVQVGLEGTLVSYAPSVADARMAAGTLWN